MTYTGVFWHVQMHVGELPERPSNPYKSMIEVSQLIPLMTMTMTMSMIH
eukprot:COSAG02_NODE_3964_length_5977_cov_24.620619_3_plen_49_part_00